MSVLQTIAWLLMAAASITITYQDFKARSISLWTVVLVLATSLSLSASNIGFVATLQNWGLNAAFLVFQLLLVMLIFGLARKQWNFFDTLMGWGDVLYLLSIAALFSTVNFLLFYVSALLVSLVGFLIYREVSKNKDTNVPLAGLLALCSLVFVAVSACFGYQPWDEIPIYLLF